jgi:hypothetical protein
VKFCVEHLGRSVTHLPHREEPSSCSSRSGVGPTKKRNRKRRWKRRKNQEKKKE